MQPFRALLSDDGSADERERQKSNFSDIHEALDHLEVTEDATLVSSYINLTNTIIGSGVLGLPFAFAASGWVLGFIIIVISGGASILSLHLLTICALKVKGDRPSSFYAVTEMSVPQLTFLIDFAVAVQCFGVGISYLIVIGGLMPDVMSQIGADSFWQEREIWVILGFAIVAPLSCFEKMDALRYTSAASIGFVIFITFIIFLYAIPSVGLDPCNHDDDNGAECLGETTVMNFSIDTLRVFSIFIFAFSCQSNMFAIVNELKDPTIARFDIICWSAIGSAFAMYAIVAACGYATYGDDVEDNILINYPNNPLTSTARVAVSLLVAFSYPLQTHPARSSSLALWEQYDKDGGISAKKFYLFRYWFITIAFLGGSFGLAMITDDLGIILALVGGTASTIISYILPGAAYYKMHTYDGPTWKRYAAATMFFIGIAITPICLVFVFV